MAQENRNSRKRYVADVISNADTNNSMSPVTKTVTSSDLDKGKKKLLSDNLTGETPQESDKGGVMDSITNINTTISSTLNTSNNSNKRSRKKRKLLNAKKDIKEGLAATEVHNETSSTSTTQSDVTTTKSGNADTDMEDMNLITSLNSAGTTTDKLSSTLPDSGREIQNTTTSTDAIGDTHKRSDQSDTVVADRASTSKTLLKELHNDDVSGKLFRVTELPKNRNEAGTDDTQKSTKILDSRTNSTENTHVRTLKDLILPRALRSNIRKLAKDASPNLATSAIGTDFARVTDAMDVSEVEKGETATTHTYGSKTDDDNNPVSHTKSDDADAKLMSFSEYAMSEKEEELYKYVTRRMQDSDENTKKEFRERTRQIMYNPDSLDSNSKERLFALIAAAAGPDPLMMNERAWRKVMGKVVGGESSKVMEGQAWLVNTNKNKTDKTDVSSKGAGVVNVKTLGPVSAEIRAATAQKRLKQKQQTAGRLYSAMEDLLNCGICFCAPEKEIYQCPNGHLLCDECHKRLISTDNSVCPNCRAVMSGTNPTRNIIAEAARDELPAECENKGCDHETTLGRIRDHTANTCEYRTVECKFGPIGCDWSGLAKEVDEHETGCVISALPGSELLEIATKQRERKAKAQIGANSVKDKESEIISLLSSKCRNIAIKDVRLEKDDMVQDICCTPFKAVKQRWIIKLAYKKVTAPKPKESSSSPAGKEKEKDKDQEKEYKVGVRIVRSGRIAHRGRTKMSFALMSGPSLAVGIPPMLFSHTFNNQDRSTPVFELPLSSVEAKRFVACHQIHLRMIFFDQRAGLNREFTSLRTGNGEVFDGLDDGGDSESECEHDDHHHHDDDVDYLEDSDDSQDGYPGHREDTSNGNGGWSHTFADDNDRRAGDDRRRLNRWAGDSIFQPGELSDNSDYTDSDEDEDGRGGFNFPYWR